MIHSGAIDWQLAQILGVLADPHPMDPHQREIVRRQHAERARTWQDGRIRTQRDHAGMPIEAAHRLKARSERLERAISYDPVRNNAVIGDPVLAAKVRRAVRLLDHRAWALIEDFRRSRIPASRALVVPPPNPTASLGQPIPRDGGVFILVESGRAIVARYRQRSPRGTYGVQHALNWEALEQDALDAVEAAAGAFWVDDHYACPPALAARARFED